MGVVARTVLIVDDHAGFRAGARALLEAEGFDVLGEAEDGESAVELARRLRPEVVLLDVQLPGMDGFAVAERLAAEPVAPTVVLISSRARSAFRTRLGTTSARGFITKAEFSGECLASLLA
jgi:DNA-binding NarL/FixJ family response regulator